MPTWVHHKTKDEYTILSFAVIEATLTPAVVYQRIGVEGKQPIWVRPAAEFFDGRFIQKVYADEEAEPVVETKPFRPNYTQPDRVAKG